jgi:hypothetical protein
VAAGEDEPQSVVAHRTPSLRSSLVRRIEGHRERGGLRVARVARALASDAIDGAVARRGGDPRARVVRRAVDRPALERGDERVLDRLLSEVDVAEEADQGGDGSSRLAPEDRRYVLQAVTRTR